RPGRPDRAPRLLVDPRGRPRSGRDRPSGRRGADARRRRVRRLPARRAGRRYRRDLPVVRRKRRRRARADRARARACATAGHRAHGLTARTGGYDRPVQQYVLSELDSGERVISERIDTVRSVAIGFWIGAGSRDEPDAKAGVSHFIEHLLFKGSRSYSAQQIAEIFDGLGGELNAATSREHTMVYARVPDAYVQPALDVMT